MNASIAKPARSLQPRAHGRFRHLPVGGTLSTDRRFVLEGHLVRTLIKYDGLKGEIGRVTCGDFGDGKVEVEFRGTYSGPIRRVCFLSREVEIIAGNEIFFTSPREEGPMKDRWLRLKVHGKLNASEKVKATCLRRADQIDDVVRAIERAKMTLEAAAAGVSLGFKNPCVAIVTVESGVAV